MQTGFGTVPSKFRLFGSERVNEANTTFNLHVVYYDSNSVRAMTCEAHAPIYETYV